MDAGKGLKLSRSFPCKGKIENSLQKIFTTSWKSWSFQSLMLHVFCVKWLMTHRTWTVDRILFHFLYVFWLKSHLKCLFSGSFCQNGPTGAWTEFITHHFDMTLEASTLVPVAPPMAKTVKRPATLDALRPVVRGFEPHLRLQLLRVYEMCLRMYNTWQKFQNTWWNGWKAWMVKSRECVWDVATITRLSFVKWGERT